jgi:DnaJ-domain-containing protein 1
MLELLHKERAELVNDLLRLLSFAGLQERQEILSIILSLCRILKDQFEERMIEGIVDG